MYVTYINKINDSWEEGYYKHWKEHFRKIRIWLPNRILNFTVKKNKKRNETNITGNWTIYNNEFDYFLTFARVHLKFRLFLCALWFVVHCLNFKFLLLLCSMLSSLYWLCSHIHVSGLNVFLKIIDKQVALLCFQSGFQCCPSVMADIAHPSHFPSLLVHGMFLSTTIRMLILVRPIIVCVS